MNALHQACARAIADANCEGARSAYCYERRADCECARAAAAAVGVCLAEAQRAVERGALDADLSKHEPGLVVALAVLAALAEDEA